MLLWQNVSLILKQDKTYAVRIFLFISLLFFISCDHASKHEARETERSFYYWRSVFKLSQQEKDNFKTLGVKTLYVKFFDVGWDGNLHTALPVAQLRAPDSSYLRGSGLNIIPTVFITNECIFKTEPAQSKVLGEKILLLVKQLAQNNGVENFKEIQVDCDWTESTKEKYFAILQSMKAADTSINYSATIRLHQVKYPDKTGIPPVNRGMLMCYNMGDLTNINTKNSILETAELKKYISNLGAYPLPLDVAYPLFDWKVLFRNGKYIGLIDNMPDSCLNSKLFLKNNNRFTATSDTVMAGYEIKKGDLLRNEVPGYEEIMNTANAVSEKLSGKKIRVALYHSDSVILRKFSAHDQENIYDAMH